MTPSSEKIGKEGGAVSKLSIYKVLLLRETLRERVTNEREHAFKKEGGAVSNL
jgi:hypothetical protein